MKIQIQNRFTERVLFEHDVEDNTVALTLRAAVASNANLCSADLCSANLRGADLRGADLRSADLCSADLRSADLRSADLCSANLRGADLRGAKLCGADLRGADLCSAKLCDEKLTKTPVFINNLIWDVCITTQSMSIGCQRHTVDDWYRFTDDQITVMEPRALAFWNQWKVPLLAMCEAHRAGEEK